MRPGRRAPNYAFCSTRAWKRPPFGRRWGRIGGKNSREATLADDHQELYFSVDIEADGPCPGLHSMLSLGCAAFRGDGQLVGSFSSNLVPLPESRPHPVTEAWWAKQSRAAYEACRTQPRPPESAIPEFLLWVQSTTRNALPVFVAWPVAFDFPFVDHYLRRFAGANPFGYKALDIQSLAMGVLGESDYLRLHKCRLPRHWIPDKPHTHVALDDAIEQGELFVNIYQSLTTTGR